MFRTEDTACCRPWRPCCCSRSCAHRPPACVCTSPTTASLSSATTTWQSESAETTTCPVTPPRTTGRPSCNPRTSPLPPPSPAGRKGLLLPQTTASWGGRSSGGRCSATAAKGTEGAGWPFPWTSPPTSWTSYLTWPRPKTCAQKRPRTRASWRTLAGESDRIRQFKINSHDRCWPLSSSFLILIIVNEIIRLCSRGEFSFPLTLRVNAFPPRGKSMQMTKHWILIRVVKDK